MFIFIGRHRGKLNQLRDKMDLVQRASVVGTSGPTSFNSGAESFVQKFYSSTNQERKVKSNFISIDSPLHKPKQDCLLFLFLCFIVHLPALALSCLGNFPRTKDQLIDETKNSESYFRYHEFTSSSSTFFTFFFMYNPNFRLECFFSRFVSDLNGKK